MRLYDRMILGTIHVVLAINKMLKETNHVILSEHCFVSNFIMSFFALVSCYFFDNKTQKLQKYP